jgi:hypothetical protein
VVEQCFEGERFVANQPAAPPQTKTHPETDTLTAKTEEFSELRVRVITLLEGTSTWTTSRTEVIEALTHQVDTLTSSLAESPHHQVERYASLRQLVEMASALAVDLGKQRSRYEVRSEKAGTLFSPLTMEDVLQDNVTSVGVDGTVVNVLQGRPIRAVVFPLVVSWGGDRGHEGSEIILKAKVLV